MKSNLLRKLKTFVFTFLPALVCFSMVLPNASAANVSVKAGRNLNEYVDISYDEGIGGDPDTVKVVANADLKSFINMGSEDLKTIANDANSAFGKVISKLAPVEFDLDTEPAIPKFNQKVSNYLSEYISSYHPSALSGASIKDKLLGYAMMGNAIYTAEKENKTLTEVFNDNGFNDNFTRVLRYFYQNYYADGQLTSNETKYLPIEYCLWLRNKVTGLTVSESDYRKTLEGWYGVNRTLGKTFKIVNQVVKFVSDADKAIGSVNFAKHTWRFFDLLFGISASTIFLNSNRSPFDVLKTGNTTELFAFANYIGPGNFATLMRFEPVRSPATSVDGRFSLLYKALYNELNKSASLTDKQFAEFAVQDGFAEAQRFFYNLKFTAVTTGKNILDNVIENSKNKLLNSDVSFGDLIRNIEYISVDDCLVYNDGSLVSDGIKYVIKGLPRPSELVDWEDHDLKSGFSWEFEIKVKDLPAVKFILLVKLYEEEGDFSQVRKLFQLLADVIDIDYSEGKFVLNINAKNLIGDIFDKVFTSSVMPEEAKTIFYQMLFSNIGELSDYFNKLTASDIITGLKRVNYVAAADVVICADALNDLLDVSVFTEDRLEKMYDLLMKLVDNPNRTIDQVKKFVNLFADASSPKLEDLYSKFERVCNKISSHNVSFENLCKLITDSPDYMNEKMYANIDKLSRYENVYDRLHVIGSRLLNKIPERYRDVTIMDLYLGNGDFGLSRDIALKTSIEEILSLVSSRFGTIGNLLQRVYNRVEENIPVDVNINLKGHFDDMYSITINDRRDNFMKKIIAPVGANLDNYAELISPVLDYSASHFGYRTADGNYTHLETMPAEDIEVYACGINAWIIGDVHGETFDVNDYYTIRVEATEDKNLTYQWYYSETGELEDLEPIEGNNQKFYTVHDVADSGYYCCKVTTIDGLSVTTGFADVSIMPREIKSIYADETDFVYSKSVQGPNFGEYDPAYVSVTNNKATCAGDYTAVVSLVEKGNTYWSDEDQNNEDFEYTVDWSINKIEFAKPVVIDDLVYDGNTKHIHLNYFDPEYMELRDYVGTVAGDFEARVWLKDPINTCWSDESDPEETVFYDWKINPVKVEAPELDVAEFTYDGEEKEIVLAENALYTITGELTGTNAGEYEIVVSLKDNKNYVWGETLDSEDVTLTWVINKAQVVKPTVDKGAFTFNTKDQSVTLTEDAATKAQYTLGGDLTAKSAGAYVAKAVLNDKANYEWADGSTDDVLLNWTIAKYQVKVPYLSSNELTYTGSKQGAYYNDLEKDYVKYTTTKQTDVGNYEYTFELKYPNDTEWKEVGGNAKKVLSWKIVKATLEKPTASNGSFTFDGTEKTLNIAGGDNTKYTISGNKQTNAGSYTAKVVIKDKKNYEWADHTNGDLSFKYTIAKAKVDAVTVKNTSFVYNGSEQAPTISTYGAGVKVTGTLKAKDAGEYKITIELTDDKNYEWKTGGKNAEVTWKISQKSVTAPAVGSTSLTYNGNEQVLAIKEGEGYTISGTVKATKAGTYEAVVSLANANYIWSTNKTDDVKVTWTIAKAVVTLPSYTWNVTGFNYDGKEHQVTLEGVTLPDTVVLSYSGTLNAYEVGGYTASATFTLADPENYEFAANTTTNYTLNWDIVGEEPAPVEPKDDNLVGRIIVIVVVSAVLVAAISIALVLRKANAVKKIIKK